jgi:hypothetical protein
VLFPSADSFDESANGFGLVAHGYKGCL